MAYKVRLSNPSSVTRKESNVSDNGDLIMSRLIYQRLGSKIHNMTISEDHLDESIPGEFIRFLDDMNKLYTEGVESQDDDSIILLDEYLGSLGNEAEYHYSKDFVDIAEWLEDLSQGPTRNVSYTDPDGVVFNVVDNGNQVIHLTGV